MLLSKRETMNIEHLSYKNFLPGIGRLIKKLLEKIRLHRLFSKYLTLILGCQRSGTTLLLLMLAVHPKIRGVDEVDSRSSFPFWSTLFYNHLKGYHTCYKLPQRTAELDLIIKRYPDSKILWIVRHPYAVISSMRLLKFDWQGGQKNWLELHGPNEFRKSSLLFPEIATMDLDRIDEVCLGAYIWKYKAMAIDVYKKKELDVLVVKYEDLLENPDGSMRKILNHLGISWSDRVLRHEQYHLAREYAGWTRGDRALDASRKKPALALTEAEKKVVDPIVDEQMSKYGYV